MGMLWIIGGLLLTNIVTIWGWYNQSRKGISKEVEALRRAIAMFESQGHTVLEIKRLNPDDIFLRSPERRWN